MPPIRLLQIKVVFNINRNNRKHTNTWKPNNFLLKEEMSKEIKDFLEFTENEGTTYPNLWNTVKAVLRGKFITLSTYKKTLERAYTSSLTAYLKALEQKETNTTKRSRWQEIIKFRTEINQVEPKKLHN